jgi:hypothetical protein
VVACDITRHGVWAVSSGHINQNRRVFRKCTSPIEQWFASTLVIAQKNNPRGQTAVGQGNTRSRGSTECRGNAWHDRIFDPSTTQRFDLFSDAPKNQWVSRFQPDHFASILGGIDQEGMDFSLCAAGAATTLPHALHMGFRRYEGKDFGRDQIIVKDGISRL